MMASSNRLYFLDPLRALAILMVVAIHAAIPYLSIDLPDLFWLIKEPAKNQILDWFCWWIEMSAMPMFFFISGFLSARQRESRGAMDFLAGKVERILIPFVLACAFVLPLAYVVWSAGWLRSGWCTLGDALMVRFEPAIERHLAGPAHLWFLEYLFIICLLYAALSKVPQKDFSPRYGVVGAPLLLALPISLILFWDPGAMFNFHNSFIPAPLRFSHYAVIFLSGAFLYRVKDLTDKLCRVFPVYLALSVPFFILAGLSLQTFFSGSMLPENRVLIAISCALFQWLFLLGLIGFCARFYGRERGFIRYLSDAAYWIYISHFPLVGFVQLGLYKIPLPQGYKFLLAFSVPLAVCLWTYPRVAGPASLKDSLGWFQRALASVILAALILFMGFSYQYLYGLEKKRYEGIITGFYQKYFERAPDPVDLEHWTMMALNKWGLQKVEQIGFLEAKMQGAK